MMTTVSMRVRAIVRVMTWVSAITGVTAAMAGACRGAEVTVVERFVAALQARQGLTVVVGPASEVVPTGLVLRDMRILDGEKVVVELDEVALTLDVGRCDQGFSAVSACRVKGGTIYMRPLDRLTRRLVEAVRPPEARTSAVSTSAASKSAVSKATAPNLRRRVSWIFDVFEPAPADAKPGTKEVAASVAPATPCASAPSAGTVGPDVPTHERVVEFEDLKVRDASVNFLFSVPYSIDDLAGKLTATGTTGHLVEVKGMTTAGGLSFMPTKRGKERRERMQGKGMLCVRKDKTFDLTRLGDADARGDIEPELWKTLTFLGYMLGGRPSARVDAEDLERR